MANIRDGVEDYEYLFQFAEKSRSKPGAHTIAATVSTGAYVWPWYCPGNVPCPKTAQAYEPVWIYDGNVMRSARASLAEVLKAHVSTQSVPFGVNQPVTVNFQNAPGTQGDSIGIYAVPNPANPPPSTQFYAAFKYTNNTTARTRSET